MRVEKSLSAKPSEPDKVDAHMKSLKHPLAGIAKVLREIILKTDPEIGEEIKWNAPAFFYTGELPPFNPKEYKRHIVVFNFYNSEVVPDLTAKSKRWLIVPRVGCVQQSPRSVAH